MFVFELHKQPLISASYIPRLQPWPSVSNLAKDFIQRLLQLDPAARLTADQAIRHPWVVTLAAGSSMRNLHRSISQNLRQRTSRSSSRCPSRTTSSGDSNNSGGGTLNVNGEKPRAAAATRQSIWAGSASEGNATASQRASGASAQSN